MCVFTVRLYVALRTYGAITAFLILRIYRFQLHEGLGFCLYKNDGGEKKQRRIHFECFLLQWIKMQDYVFNRIVRCCCCFLFHSIALLHLSFPLWNSFNSSIHTRTSSLSWNLSLCFVKTVKWMHMHTHLPLAADCNLQFISV